MPADFCSPTILTSRLVHLDTKKVVKSRKASHAVEILRYRENPSILDNSFSTTSKLVEDIPVMKNRYRVNSLDTGLPLAAGEIISNKNITRKMQITSRAKQLASLQTVDDIASDISSIRIGSAQEESQGKRPSSKPKKSKKLTAIVNPGYASGLTSP